MPEAFHAVVYSILGAWLMLFGRIDCVHHPCVNLLLKAVFLGRIVS